jgi:hypothetical protein
MVSTEPPHISSETGDRFDELAKKVMYIMYKLVRIYKVAKDEGYLLTGS